MNTNQKSNKKDAALAKYSPLYIFKSRALWPSMEQLIALIYDPMEHSLTHMLMSKPSLNHCCGVNTWCGPDIYCTFSARRSVYLNAERKDIRGKPIALPVTPTKRHFQWKNTGRLRATLTITHTRNYDW